MAREDPHPFGVVTPRNASPAGDRPEIPAYWPEEIRTLLESCWHQEPDKRPTFGKALETIDSITVEIADRVLPPTKWWHVLVCGAC
mmetsp:Transcript_48811/g.156349  ORF Transcript_48811/g.156349 Transcript_48811/m.156349 type:complete len:86 (+) Transcript_48811:1399-1656(+)